MPSEEAKRWSYSSTPMGVRERLHDIYALARIKEQGARQSVALTLRRFRTMQSRLKETCAFNLSGKKVLEIGPGQQLGNMRCLSLDNDVMGIDMDVIPQGFRLLDYVEMARVNSAMRVLKTVGRKALGFDRQFETELARELGVPGFPRLPVRRLDASHTGFRPASFDLVCSYSVFEHIERPAEALREAAFVLAPGGVAYISLHLYTSHSGSHDARVARADVRSPPQWPHLRAAYRDTIHPSAYCNKISLAEWKRLFTEAMPGVTFVHETHDEIADICDKLLAEGELQGYTREELLTLNLVAIWQKPRASHTPSIEA